ncbi:MAG: hypothetical protein RLY93_04610 [Sumerlaeia bacterium]
MNSRNIQRLVRRSPLAAFGLIFGLFLVAFSLELGATKADALVMPTCPPEYMNVCDGNYACNSNTAQGGWCLSVGIAPFAVCVGVCPDYCVSTDTYDECEAFTDGPPGCPLPCDGCTGGTKFRSANSCLGVAVCTCNYTIPLGGC